MTETEVKYIAGLLDADGYIGFEFTDKRVSLSIKLTAADSIDKRGFVFSLPYITGFGSSCRKEKRGDWSTINVWSVSSRKDHEMLSPRLCKHMVIKGAHLQRMYDKWQEFRGRKLSDIEIEQLKAYQKASRASSGPVKPKKHPTWAWVAGYLDGDGSYIFSCPPSHNGRPRLLIQATSHINDRVGVDLLLKAFGGKVFTRGETAPHILDWKHGLGKSEKSFALKFLKKMAQHSRLKKHKIEQMLAYHNSNQGLAQTK